jgi:hypothetical protein
MRQRRRYQPISHRDHPLGFGLLNETRFCRKHGKRFAANVVNNGRIESGRCPECYPPKPPVEPEGSSK